MGMKTFRHYLVEMINGKYSYSSTQIDLPADAAAKVVQWGKKHLKDRDIYTDPKDASLGREDEIHATILYGLHTSLPGSVKKRLEGEKGFKCKLGKIKKFDVRPEYDVLYVDIQGSGLHRLNRMLKDLPYTSNFPTYRPHVTIAYVKKGRGDKYLGSDVFSDIEFHIDKIVFSSKEGKKTIIDLEEK
jgi:2'-5' RNA ligase